MAAAVCSGFNILRFACPKAEAVLGIRLQNFIADNN
jgi:hypothetical protein